MNPNNFGDIDIDVQNRDQVVEILDNIPASIIKEETIEKHNTGIYVQEVPVDPITGLCSLDYERAEDLGYIKLDILNLAAYANVESSEHIDKLISQEPDWSLLQHREVVEALYHINGHYDIVDKLKPQSVDQLAMVLAIIRPGKRYLLNKTWSEIEKEVWVKKEGDKYHFKRSHSIAYATLIVMQLNQLVEES